VHSAFIGRIVAAGIHTVGKKHNRFTSLNTHEVLGLLVAVDEGTGTVCSTRRALGGTSRPRDARKNQFGIIASGTEHGGRICIRDISRFVAFVRSSSPSQAGRTGSKRSDTLRTSLSADRYFKALDFRKPQSLHFPRL
jgi:hypothetical protein